MKQKISKKRNSNLSASLHRIPVRVASSSNGSRSALGCQPLIGRQVLLAPPLTKRPINNSVTAAGRSISKSHQKPTKLKIENKNRPDEQNGDGGKNEKNDPRSKKKKEKRKKEKNQQN